MNIAIITPGFAANETDYGGAAAILNLLKQLASYKDVNLSVFALYYPALQPFFSVAGMSVFTFAKKNPNDKMEKLRIWRECKKKFSEEHKKKPFEMIHSMWSGESGNAAAGLAEKFNLPFITNINGGELGEIKEINFGARLTLFQKKFVNRSIEQADKIVCGSEFISGLVQKYYGDKIHSKVSKLPFGVDAKMFSPAKKKFDPDAPVLINIANAVPVKSHITLFKALKIVKLKIPGVRLECYGRDDKNLLKKLAEEHGVSDCVKLNGFIDYEKIPEALHNADIFVLSSLYESQNMSVIEAAFCGLPVVSTSVGAAPEIAKNIVKPGDHIALAEKIIEVIENYTSEKQNALSQLDLLINNYSIESVSENFVKLYKSLL